MALHKLFYKILLIQTYHTTCVSFSYEFILAKFCSTCGTLKEPKMIVVVELVLYVHGQQLRSCRDGQLSYPHCSRTSLPEAGYQYLAPILSPLSDKCSFGISGRGKMAVEIFS